MEIEKSMFMEELMNCYCHVMTDAEDTVAQQYWYRGIWQDCIETYWRNLTEYETMPPSNRLGALFAFRVPSAQRCYAIFVGEAISLPFCNKKAGGSYPPLPRWVKSSPQKFFKNFFKQ